MWNENWCVVFAFFVLKPLLRKQARTKTSAKRNRTWHCSNCCWNLIDVSNLVFASDRRVSIFVLLLHPNVQLNACVGPKRDLLFCSVVMRLFCLFHFIFLLSSVGFIDYYNWCCSIVLFISIISFHPTNAFRCTSVYNSKRNLKRVDPMQTSFRKTAIRFQTKSRKSSHQYSLHICFHKDGFKTIIKQHKHQQIICLRLTHVPVRPKSLKQLKCNQRSI